MIDEADSKYLDYINNLSKNNQVFLDVIGVVTIKYARKDNAVKKFWGYKRCLIDNIMLLEDMLKNDKSK